MSDDIVSIGYKLGNDFVSSIPDDFTLPIPGCPSLNLINSRYLPELTEAIQAFIASTIADLINAGSEREAVMENQELHDAIFAELKGWSNTP